MRFVNDDQIPKRLAQVGLFGAGKLVGAEDDFWLIERIEVAAPDGLIERLGFKNGRRQKEFVAEFLAPLLPQICRTDDEQLTASFRPSLREQDNAGLDMVCRVVKYEIEKGTPTNGVPSVKFDLPIGPGA